MKTRYKILIIVLISFSALMSYEIIIGIIPRDNFESANEGFSCAGIHLKKLSDYDIDRIHDTPVVLSQEQLQESPVIYDLVLETNQMTPPKNDRGYAEITFDEMISLHRLLKQEIIRQHGSIPEDFIEKPPPAHQKILSQPNMTDYLYAFKTPKIIYNNNTYDLNGVSAFPPQPIEQINVQLANYEYSKTNTIWIELSHDDLAKHSKILDAINQIGTWNDSIQVNTEIDENVWTTTEEWFVQQQKMQNVTSGHLFEYNDEIYSIGFVIC